MTEWLDQLGAQMVDRATRFEQDRLLPHMKAFTTRKELASCAKISMGAVDKRLPALLKAGYVIRQRMRRKGRNGEFAYYKRTMVFDKELKNDWRQQ